MDEMELEREGLPGGEAEAADIEETQGPGAGETESASPDGHEAPDARELPEATPQSVQRRIDNLTRRRKEAEEGKAALERQLQARDQELNELRRMVWQIQQANLRQPATPAAPGPAAPVQPELPSHLAQLVKDEQAGPWVAAIRELARHEYGPLADQVKQLKQTLDEQARIASHEQQSREMVGQVENIYRRIIADEKPADEFDNVLLQSAMLSMSEWAGDNWNTMSPRDFYFSYEQELRNRIAGIKKVVSAREQKLLAGKQQKLQGAKKAGAEAADIPGSPVPAHESDLKKRLREGKITPEQALEEKIDKDPRMRRGAGKG